MVKKQILCLCGRYIVLPWFNVFHLTKNCRMYTELIMDKLMQGTEHYWNLSFAATWEIQAHIHMHTYGNGHDETIEHRYTNLIVLSYWNRCWLCVNSGYILCSNLSQDMESSDLSQWTAPNTKHNLQCHALDYVMILKSNPRCKKRVWHYFCTFVGVYM